MRQWRRAAILTAFATCCALGIAPPVLPQSATQTYPAYLPYSFSNFAWWTDDELRLLLKKRIPGLRDEIATTSQAEARIRDALTALLREKGIGAQVMSEEPSLMQLDTTPPDLLGVDLDDDSPPIPKPSIVFELVKPRVSVGSIKVQANTDDAQAAVEKFLRDEEGRGFTQGSLSFSQYQIEKSLKQLGYFSAQVILRHGPPCKQGDRYLVDETVLIDSGPKFRIASITADGGPLLAGKDLSIFFAAHAGDLAVPYPFGQLGPQLRAFYEQFGYADVHITSGPILDREHATVSYALHVNPGPVYHLRTLTIQKLDSDQEKRVREILGMRPGDLFREQAIIGLYHAIPNEPLLKGYTFSYSPKPDRAAAAVDLTLDFGKEGDSATVTIQ